MPSGRGSPRNSLLWARWGFKGDNQHLEEQSGQQLVQLRPQWSFWGEPELGCCHWASCSFRMVSKGNSTSGMLQ